MELIGHVLVITLFVGLALLGRQPEVKKTVNLSKRY